MKEFLEEKEREFEEPVHEEEQACVVNFLGNLVFEKLACGSGRDGEKWREETVERDAVASMGRSFFLPSFLPSFLVSTVC